MKIGIFANDTPQTEQIKNQLEQKLSDRHITIDNADPDIVITIGGDGTLLSAFHHYQEQLETIRFLGVHTGHLGFYTDWRADELDDLVISLQSDNGQAVSYPLLDISVTYHDENQARHYLALNEATLKRIGMTMGADVYIGGELFERFRGDGLCVSTPTGSTAYNKSLGGAVIHPSLNVIQLTEIGSLNNLVYRTISSPMIVPANDWITIVPNQASDFFMTVDQENIYGKQIEQIMFKVSKRKIRFAKYRHTEFWRRVQAAFIGDLNEN
ncbi:NAD kinase [Ligilactobacillus aviarius]|uniref:NAD kinase n=1 Tax=Ligilactobacillus aviarius TaxID=1606 RepID=UPI0007D8E7A4|nr:NAD kinase [Ligilactobacillus aviarius]OAQ01889.1 NAD kinase [Ligilactobacillus aviarius]OAQ04849.1 NAD kinase [Ligilactobacillus aviarius]OAQ08285.1 NAD kinase [Ligilactobacillus aviarius]OAS75938.1 NAD kinase [Ligilactobacillus aviarius]OAS80607.1 NAD kinase [Ligilactobacillus aviarius]